MNNQTNNERVKIAIYGAGGFAREVAWLLAHSQNHNYQFVGYVEDGTEENRNLNGYPVMSLEKLIQDFPEVRISIAVGNPSTRRKLAEKVIAAGLLCETLVDETVRMSEFNTIGNGSIICAGSILTVNIDIMEQVHINLDCTIGHDVTLSSFVTLAPGVHVSGNVFVGENVYIGTGAAIINGTPDKKLIIGASAVIGAGACLTKDVEPNALYAGVPAKLKKIYN